MANKVMVAKQDAEEPVDAQVVSPEDIQEPEDAQVVSPEDIQEEDPNTISRFMGKAKQALSGALADTARALPGALADTARAIVPGGAGYLGAGMGQNGPQQAQNIQNVTQATAPIARPALEMGGMMAGGALGATAGTAVGGPGIGTGAGAVIGAGLGQGAGRLTADVLEEKAGIKPSSTLSQAAQSVVQGVQEGALNEAVNPLVGAAATGLAKGVGAVAKPVLGKLTSSGTEAIEKALESGRKLKGNIFKSQTDFDKALRGEVNYKGEDIVENTKDALNTLKEKRASAYQNALKEISTPKVAPGTVAKPGEEPKLPDLDISNIQNKVAEILPKYVRVDKATGLPDWSRSALGTEKSEGVKKMKAIVELLKDFGTKEGDKNVLGLDMLKRQLDDFYGETSQARSFVASLRNVVKDTITKQVPEYAEMTKGYNEATKLVKDIESGLMLRKQGISGRIVADQTLRRIMTATQDNAPLRKDLVNALSDGSGKELMAQISGHVLNPVLPRGLMGGASALAVGAEAMHLLNPSVAPLLLAASPRAVGEFLRIYGKGLQEVGKVAPIATRAATYGTQQLGKNDQAQPLPVQTLTAPQATPQPAQGGGVLSALGPKKAYAEGPMPNQAPMPMQKPTGVAPGTEKSPYASPAAKSLRFAIQAHNRGDYRATIQALYKAIQEEPKLAAEYQNMINNMYREQQAMKERGLAQ